MKSTDIQLLKQLSQDVVDLMPYGLMADAYGRFYSEGERVSATEVLMMIENSRERVLELNHAIHKLEGRKSPQNNTKEQSIVGQDDEK